MNKKENWYTEVIKEAQEEVQSWPPWMLGDTTRKYDDFAKDKDNLGEAMKEEIKDIIKKEDEDTAVESIFNLIIDTKYEW